MDTKIEMICYLGVSFCALLRTVILRINKGQRSPVFENGVLLGTTLMMAGFNSNSTVMTSAGASAFYATWVLHELVVANHDGRKRLV